MEQKKNNRNVLLDIVKGIAISLVIVGHVIQCGMVEINFFENKLFILIYSFHMPLFMLVSGYLFYFSMQKHSNREILINRILKLLYAIFIWGTISFIIHLASGTKILGGTFIDGTLNYLLYLVNYLWFLWAIIFASLTLLFAEKVIKNKTVNIIFLSVLNIVLMIVPDFYGAASACKYMMPYFILSFYFAKYMPRLKLNKNKNLIIFAACAVMFVGLIMFYNTSAYIYTTGYSILEKGRVFKQTVIDVYRFVIGLVGSIAAVYLTYYLQKYLTCFQSFGKNSLEIYTISTILFTQWLTNYTRTIPFNYLFVFIESLGILTFCFIVSFVLNKNKIVRGVFFGFTMPCGKIAANKNLLKKEKVEK